jgi:hypothetical protein
MKDFETGLTIERLKALLKYDPETGSWTYGVSRRGLPAGKKAGYTRDDGYVCLMVDRRRYRSSRLAVFYMTGEWPSEEVDHIDRDKSNNRWANLRVASRSDNQANNPAYANNKIGVKGVYPFKSSKRNPYTAQIRHGGKTYHLGVFATIEDASRAYVAAAEKAFGEFALGAQS